MSRMEDTMSDIGRRLVKVGGGHLEVETFEVPVPGPGEVLMRVHRSQVSAGSEGTALKSGPQPDEKGPPHIRPEFVGWQPGGEPVDYRRFTGYTTGGAGPGRRGWGGGVQTRRPRPCPRHPWLPIG